jgi:F-type H+-transporting ATPase subunit b
MKIPDIGRKHRRLGKRIFAITIMTCLIAWMGVAAASSGGSQGGHAAKESSAQATHEDGGHDAHASAHESKGWVALDTYRVINFSVLAIALFFILRKPVSQALSSRIEGIRNQLKELEEKKVQAEKELAKYSQKLAELDKEAKKVVDSYIRQGQEAKARIIAEAKNSAEKLEAQALRNIEHEFKQAKESIQAEIVEKALMKAEILIKEKVSDQDQERLVDEYLQKVVA